MPPPPPPLTRSRSTCPPTLCLPFSAPHTLLAPRPPAPSWGGRSSTPPCRPRCRYEPYPPPGVRRGGGWESGCTLVPRGGGVGGEWYLLLLPPNASPHPRDGTAGRQRRHGVSDSAEVRGIGNKILKYGHIGTYTVTCEFGYLELSSHPHKLSNTVETGFMFCAYGTIHAYDSQ